MSARKSERLLNLTIALLSARMFLSREQIRILVSGYHGLSDEAYDRRFERDKDELRSLGVPVEMGSNSALFEDEVGYRIRPAAFQLPEIEFNAAEQAVLAAAKQVWQQTQMAETTGRALAKLGADAADNPFTAFTPSMNVQDAAFWPLLRALSKRQVVTFNYRDGALRTVEPWRLIMRRGSWYLLSYDRGKGEPRTFKLPRISSAVREVGEPEAFSVPADVDSAALLAKLDASPADAVAVVAIREGRAAELTARGTKTTWRTPLPTGFTAWRVPYPTQVGLVADVAAAGGDCLPLDPPELVAGVRSHLAALVASLGKGEALR
ncbi:MAG: WYL domain-containing protein [Propionibacteriaceae bacterium]|jgi:proteasome accessory factor B|nr:WYL domain-containing protein [Propionibacteriaceae bacterium]